MIVRTHALFLVCLTLGYAPTALSQDNTLDILSKQAEKALKPINFYFKTQPISSAKGFADLGKRIQTTQGFAQLKSPLLTTCTDEKNNLVLKNGVLMSSENAREIDEAEKHAPPGYKLIMLMDVSTSGVGLPDQTIPNQITKPYNPYASEYYRYLQAVGQKYSVDQFAERQQGFNDILMNGWTETKKDGTTVKHPSYLSALGLNPQNPADFERILLSFSDLLHFKPYDNVKLEEDKTTDYGVIDALTTNVRGGVCTDYATWIAEMMSLTGVAGVAGGDFKRVVSTVTQNTVGAGHAMGRIRDPHTGEYYTVNYSQILKLKDGSLVPFDQILNDKGFGFTNAGIMINRGEIRNEHGKVSATEDRMSGVSLTPFGKELQNVVYDDKTFETLKIQPVTGVMRTQRATVGASFQKDERTLSNPYQTNQSWDIGVTYINLGGIEGQKNTERAMLWGKYKYEDHGKKSDSQYQIFLGGGGGSGLNQFATLDMAMQYAPHVTYDLKFLDPHASITFRGQTGLRSMLYVQTNIDKEYHYDKKYRTDMTLYDPETNQNVANYDPQSQAVQPIGTGLYDPNKTYKIKDPHANETWLWADRNEIVPYKYEINPDLTKDVTQYSVNGNVRNFNSLKAEIKLNENFTVFGEGILGVAPSTKNISTARGSVSDVAKTMYFATEQGYQTGAQFTAQAGTGSKVMAGGSYKRLNNPFGYRQFGQIRLDYVKGTKDFFIYFNSSRFNDFTMSGANNFDEYGAGYTGPIFKGSTGSASAGVVNYPQTNMNLIQGTLRMNIGTGSKKKKK